MLQTEQNRYMIVKCEGHTDPVVTELRETTETDDSSYHEVQATCAQCNTDDPPKPSKCLVYGRDVSVQKTPVKPYNLAQVATGRKKPSASGRRWG